MHAHRLSLALGVWNVNWLMDRMSASQFTDWLAYFDLEPWGGRLDDFRDARLVALLMNAFRNQKKHRKEFVISDFMLTKLEAPPQQKVDTTWQKARTWALIHNANLARKKGN